MDDNTVKITLGGEEYGLLFTTRATKEISKRYGGLTNLGTKMEEAKSADESLDSVIWLITTLANQSIAVHNLKHPDNKKEPLTEEMVEILSTPKELAGFSEAIAKAISEGTGRSILSEEEPGKNVATE